MRRERRLRRRLRKSHEAPWSRFAFGLAVLAAGVLFLLDHLGRIDAREWIRWWPFAAVAMGVAHLLDRRWFGAAIWVLFGGYFLLPLFGIAGPKVWYLIGVWPLLISVAGVTLMMQAFRRGNANPSVRALAVMGGNVRKVAARFDGGEAIAVMGACEIDLTNAQIEREAIIDVLAFWGGIGIRVPRNWNVVSNVAAVLGGYDDRTAETSEDAPRLIVRGSAIMGGIEVKNPKEAAA